MTFFIIFLLVWGIVATVLVYGHLLRQKELSSIRRFNGEFFNVIYQLSYLAPFKWFVEDDRNLTKKGVEMDMLLKMSRFDRYFTVRSFMAFHFSLLVLSMMLSGLVIYMMQYAGEIFSFMFAIELETGGVTRKQGLMIYMGSLVLALIPKWYLKTKAKRELVNYNKELPTIQMFVILMLKSNKTVREVLYALSRLNTYHRETFETAYRIYTRNPAEGMLFLKKEFNKGRFAEMFDLLEDIGEYARSETVTILEGNMRSLTEEANEVKRKNDINRLMYSQFSMAPPFGAIILLGVLPVLMNGMSNFSINSGL